MECIVCRGKIDIEKIEEEKLEKLKEADKSLEGEDIRKAVCKECGNTAYIKS